MDDSRLLQGLYRIFPCELSRMVRKTVSSNAMKKEGNTKKDLKMMNKSEPGAEGVIHFVVLLQGVSISTPCDVVSHDDHLHGAVVLCPRPEGYRKTSCRLGDLLEKSHSLRHPRGIGTSLSIFRTSPMQKELVSRWSVSSLTDRLLRSVFSLCHHRCVTCSSSLSKGHCSVKCGLHLLGSHFCRDV